MSKKYYSVFFIVFFIGCAPLQVSVPPLDYHANTISILKPKVKDFIIVNKASSGQHKNPIAGDTIIPVLTDIPTAKRVETDLKRFIVSRIDITDKAIFSIRIVTIALT